METFSVIKKIKINISVSKKYDQRNINAGYKNQGNSNSVTIKLQIHCLKNAKLSDCLKFYVVVFCSLSY